MAAAAAGGCGPGLLVLPAAGGQPGCFRRQPEGLRQAFCKQGRFAAVEKSGAVRLSGGEAETPGESTRESLREGDRAGYDARCLGVTVVSVPVCLAKYVQLQNKQVQCLDCEATHMLLLSFDGKLSEHRATASANCFETRLLKELGNRHIVQIACGDHHSMALSRGGELFTWGQNAHGQLGVGGQVTCTAKPQLVDGLKGIALAHIAAGGAHSLVVSLSGAVYSWGKNDFGQLGLGHMEDRDHPSYVEALQHWKTVFISCGADHTAVLSKDGLVCTFGAGEAGQLGHNSTRNEQTPRIVAELWGARVSQVACGRRHTLVYVPSLGKVYSFGSGEEGQLGNEGKSNQLIPLPINLPVDNGECNQGNSTSQKEIKIIAGGNQSIVLLLKKRNSYLNLNGIATLKDAWISNSCSQKWEETKNISLIFSSEACINGSFLEKRDKHFRTSKEISGVDMSEVLCFYEEISCKPKLFQKVKEEIKKLLPSLSSSPISPENFRIYLILPFLLRGEDDTSYHSLSLLAQAIMRLQPKDLQTLESLWSNLEASFFKELVSIYQRASQNNLSQFIWEVLFQRDLSKMDGEEGAALHLLQILFQVNSRAGFGIHKNNFYVCEVKEIIKLNFYMDMEESLQMALWKLTRYPCIFDRQDKIAVHDIECKALSTSRSVTAINFPVFVNESWSFLVRRQHLLHDIWDILNNAVPEQFKKILQVTFVGEEGIDEGALSQELFSVAARALCQPKGGAFRHFASHLVWFPRQVSSRGNTFFLIGTLFGMALFNKCLAPFPFPRALYKKMLQVAPTLEDLKELMPSEGRSLQEILDEERDDIFESLDMDFTITEEEGSSTAVIELKKDGTNIPVTKHNRKEFADLYVNYVFNESIQKPFEDFMQGFLRGCPAKKWKMFLPVELQTVFEGYAKYDWHRLEKCVKYVGYKKSDQTIKDFWTVFHELPEEKKKMFLAFLSGSDRISAYGLEYFTFVIRDPEGENPDTNYPVSNTCRRILFLPRYSCKRILKKMFLSAIKHCENFSLP
ncbi:E3 ISG15--protein ligase HERC5-like [Dromaius novaehollandiae]|uniref:E3 ISG15--protein ligase HERC5-like n=1 Tax=Dromaius novaehollandiae TaxID=8790 RepID=UPI003120477C